MYIIFLLITQFFSGALILADVQSVRQQMEHLRSNVLPALLRSNRYSGRQNLRYRRSPKLPHRHQQMPPLRPQERRLGRTRPHANRETPTWHGGRWWVNLRRRRQQRFRWHQPRRGGVRPCDKRMDVIRPFRAVPVQICRGIYYST